MRYIRACGLCSAMLIFGLAASASASALRITYADIESFPYHLGEGQAVPEKPGVAIEVMQRVGGKLGLAVEFHRLPGKRVFEELKNGSFEAALMYSYRDDRLQYGAYPMKDGKPDHDRRMTTLTYSLYHPAGKAVMWDGKAFGNPKVVVGANTTWSIVGDLKALGVTVEEARTTEQNIKKLLMGRIDAYASQDIVVDSYLQQSGTSGVDKLSPPLSSKDYFLMLSNQFVQAQPDLAEKIWNEVAAVRDGEFCEIMAKYAE